MDNIKNVYICATYYHLLISIIKALESNVKSDLVFAINSKKEYSLINNSEMISKLKEYKIFNNIYIYDFSGLTLGLRNLKNSVKSIFFINKKIKNKEFDFSTYNDVYTYIDTGVLGYILGKQKVYCNLIEDGTGCYSNKYDKARHKDKNILKIMLQTIYRKFNINSDMGHYKYIKSIEVNSKQDISIKHKNIIEISKKELIDKLSERNREILIDIFLSKQDVERLEKGTTLILTQPLNEEDIIETEEEKIKLYISIINKYAKNEKVLLKPHPRELTDYYSYFEKINNVEILNPNYPIEIINILNKHFKKIITIFSTAINSIERYDEKIELIDYVKDGKIYI